MYFYVLLKREFKNLSVHSLSEGLGIEAGGEIIVSISVIKYSCVTEFCNILG